MTVSHHVPATTPSPLVVVVDGDCALCVGLVEWMGRRIKPSSLDDLGISPQVVTFVPGQSDIGSEVLARASVTDFDSVLVVRQGAILIESRAVLALATILPRRYRALAAVARIVPKRAADVLYRTVAKHRIRIWGRVEVCAIDSRVAGATYGPRGLLSRDDARQLLVLAGALKN
jgi:predicted DCC family thiol-disulfide oxidoreductase YuxK